jgi:hypothetical protein
MRVRGLSGMIQKKNFRGSFAFILFLALGISSCSKDKDSSAGDTPIPNVEAFPITAEKLSSCHFQNPSPTYTYQAPITANPILCKDGVPKKVELLTPTLLPSGLQFSMDNLSLTGVANEKTAQTPYQYYVENEAGYMIINLNVTVK